MSCSNVKCKWHRRDGEGCKLFEGRAWEKCRKAVRAAERKPAVKGPRK